MAVPAFPKGGGKKVKSIVTIDDAAVVLSAFRKIYHQNSYLLRLYESSGQERDITVSFPEFGFSHNCRMKPFEVKTLKMRKEEKCVEECGIFGE